MEQLTKEQLLKIKDELQKVLSVLYTISIDYQTRLQHVDKMIKELETPIKVSEKPAESKKS